MLFSEVILYIPEAIIDFSLVEKVSSTGTFSLLPKNPKKF